MKTRRPDKHKQGRVVADGAGGDRYDADLKGEGQADRNHHALAITVPVNAARRDDGKAYQHKDKRRGEV